MGQSDLDRLPDFDLLIEAAEAAADAARAVIRPYFRAGVTADTKPDRSPVTIADRGAEQALRTVLGERFPDYGIHGEEFGETNKGASLCWVLDPIDGTRAFITGRLSFGTLIALLHDGRPVLGLIDQPVTGERWIGVAGRPTVFRGPFGGRAGCRRCARLDQAELSLTSIEVLGPTETTPWERLHRAARRTSFGGDCYGYGLLALGHIDVIAEATMHLWDWAALVPVIEGAGGRLTDWHGRKLTPDSDGHTLAVGDPALLAQAVEFWPLDLLASLMAPIINEAKGRRVYRLRFWEERMRHVPMTLILIAGLAVGTAGPAHAQTRTYGLSLLQPLALPANFAHFPYVNPDAPKGGEVALSEVGTFDSFNPFIVRGTPAGDVSRVWDTLLRADADEAEAAYGHLAQTIEIPADHMGVVFELHPEAKFNDGTPVTAEDVAWTLQTLRAQGRPFYREYYADVGDVTVDSPTRVVFHFKSAKNRELPLILGQMPVLPKHWWDGRDFSRPLTDPPLGSGPYRVDHFEFGRTLALARVKDWWASKLPTAIGLDNFDVRRTEYFRDATVALEGFKAGQIDYRTENVAKDWATAYDFPAVQKGLVKKELIRHHLPTGMQGFAMNTRRPLFKDVRLRHALALAFDFEWENVNLFYGAYTRTESYFSNSDLASSGLPTGEELAILQKYADQLPPRLFTEPFKLPVTDGSGNNREGLRQALALLGEAGWKVVDQKLVDANGNQMSFEILLDQPAFERVSLPYVQWLGRLGIDARVRTVDSAQYQRLTDSYDYDMTIVAMGESDSPGNEQTGYWTCEAAKQDGGDNIMGICNPVVDALVNLVVNAPDRDHLVASTRALDRVLLWNWYVVPQWHLQSVRIAYWDRFGRPSQPVRTGVVFDAWWIDPARAAAIDAARGAGN